MKTNKEKRDSYQEIYRENSNMIKSVCKEDKKKCIDKKCEKIEFMYEKKKPVAQGMRKYGL